MQRREFIALFGGVAAMWPLGARAQKTKHVIAILGSGAADAGSSKQMMSMLDASLREVGLWVATHSSLRRANGSPRWRFVTGCLRSIRRACFRCAAAFWAMAAAPRMPTIRAGVYTGRI
jgi:hypothetical protein